MSCALFFAFKSRIQVKYKNYEMNNDSDVALAPSALMLLSEHCAHCTSILEFLAKMVKRGEIASLKVINLERTPDAMQEYNVRSVPWVRIGKHELTGAQTLEALQQRAEWAKNDLLDNDNTVAEFDFLLSDGQVDKVVQIVIENPEKIQSILKLLGDSGTVLSTRIGIGVVFEEIANSNLIKSIIPQLAKLRQNSDQRIRADAYHYLGMTGDPAAIPILITGKNDIDEEVREIAIDSLNEITGSNA